MGLHEFSCVSSPFYLCANISHFEIIILEKSTMLPHHNKKRGFVLLVTAVAMFVLVGMLGLAVDLGRVYIIKNEAQAYADVAAISAARHLNGKQSGIDAANAEVAGSTNSWNFGTQAFTSSTRTVEFAKSSSGPWDPAPSNPLSGYGYVRVTASPVLNLAFMPAVGASSTQQVRAQAVAGVVPETFPAGGYMPFTPFAHSGADPNFGFTIGEEYGFLWPGNINNRNNACEGDRAGWPAYDFSDNSVINGSDRGYFELQAASAISNAILGGAQTDALNVGDQITLTNGQKQAEQSALATRAGYDTDLTDYSASSGTAPAYRGNGMRLVIMPVNSAVPVNGKVTVIGFAAFLLPISYPNGGNKAWCAIYMGSATEGGGVSPYPDAGAYVVRLVQ
jgi:Flp pilus assembly protein TadG